MCVNKLHQDYSADYASKMCHLLVPAAVGQKHTMQALHQLYFTFLFISIVSDGLHLLLGV